MAEVTAPVTDMEDEHWAYIVRRRLENYHADESVYHPPTVRMSHINSRSRQPAQLPMVLVRKIELDQAIADLPPVERAVIRLRYVADGISYKEMLPMLNVSRATFYRLMAEGIRKIARQLRERSG